MILVADNLQILNPRVAGALEDLDPKPLQEIALRCAKSGANLLDLNPGYLSKRREDRMTFMVEAVQEVTSLRLVLDSPNPRVLARGLAACRETPVLNALSLEEHKLAEILPLAVEHQTDLVILLMDERSFTPPSLEEKIGLAIELREHALAAGLPQEKLIFDPVLPTLSWQDAVFQISQVIKTVRLLDSGAVFQESVRTMAGLSNLRSTQRDRIHVRLEEICLSLLAGAGLHFALADLLQKEITATAGIINRMT